MYEEILKHRYTGTKTAPCINTIAVAISSELWRRGWDLNPLPLLDTRNLLILRYAQYAKSAQSARRRYTAGTRNTAVPMLAEPGPDSMIQKNPVN